MECLWRPSARSKTATVGFRRDRAPVAAVAGAEQLRGGGDLGDLLEKGRLVALYLNNQRVRRRRRHCVRVSDATGGSPDAMVVPPDIEAQILRSYHAENWTVGTIARLSHIHRSVVRRVRAEPVIDAARTVKAH